LASSSESPLPIQQGRLICKKSPVVAIPESLSKQTSSVGGAWCDERCHAALCTDLNFSTIVIAVSSVKGVKIFASSISISLLLWNWTKLQ